MPIVQKRVQQLQQYAFSPRATEVPLAIPTFRRLVSFVGRAEGWDHFAPADETTFTDSETDCKTNRRNIDSAQNDYGFVWGGQGRDLDGNEDLDLDLDYMAPAITPPPVAESYSAFAQEQPTHFAADENDLDFDLCGLGEPLLHGAQPFPAYTSRPSSPQSCAADSPSPAASMPKVEPPPQKLEQHPQQQQLVVVKAEPALTPPPHEVHEHKFEREGKFGELEFEYESDMPEVVVPPRERKLRAPVVASADDDLALASAQALELMNLYTNTTEREDRQVVLGTYTRAERRAKIARYQAKKQRRNMHSTHYVCRKEFAEKRPRVGGRFITKQAWEEMKEQNRSEGKGELSSDSPAVSPAASFAQPSTSPTYAPSTDSSPLFKTSPKRAPLSGAASSKRAVGRPRKVPVTHLQTLSPVHEVVLRPPVKAEPSQANTLGAIFMGGMGAMGLGAAAVSQQQHKQESKSSMQNEKPTFLKFEVETTPDEDYSSSGSFKFGRARDSMPDFEMIKVDDIDTTFSPYA